MSFDSDESFYSRESMKPLQAEIDRLKQELATEREKARKLREGLKKLEWSDHNEFEDRVCPVCGMQQELEQGHKPNCRLAALLEETK